MGFNKEIGEFGCEYCDKVFSSNQSLYAHISHCKPTSNRTQYIFTDEDRAKSYESLLENLENGTTVYEGNPHTQDTKRKLRKRRIEYMQKHPEKTAWFRRHSSKKSFPEITFEDELKGRNIEGWVYDYRCGIYQYDFAFINKKLDVEVDGSYHLSKEQQQKDKIRDKWSIDNGWKVLRIPAKRILNDVKIVVNELEDVLNDI